MADDNRIIPFRGRITGPAAVAGEPTISAVDRHELMLEELRAELRGELFSLNRVVEQQVRVLQVHHTALVDLTAALHTLQQRTWGGRIRRLLVRLEDWRHRFRRRTTITDGGGTCPDCRAHPIDPANGVACAECWQLRTAW